VITNIDYSPTEQPTLIQYGNGTTTTNTYNPDKLYRLQQKVTTAPTQPISAPTLINDKLDSSAVVGKPRLFNISTNAANPRVTISSFTANPTTITDGQSSTLQWSLTGGNPRTLTLTTDTGNTTSVVGKTSLIVNPTKTTTYTLKADNISTASVTITVTAASPTITPNGGTITATQTIALATVTTNAKIYYSTNNSTPTTASTEYTSPFTLNTLATVKAITVKPGLTQSSVASATFAVTQPPPSQVAAPSVSPNGGNFTSPVSVILSTNTIGADIYYTLDSTTPTTASTKYTEGSQGITLSQSTIVKVIAVKPGMTNSIVTTSNNFVVTAPAQVAAPSISPNGGNFTNSTSVVLSTNTTESDIYYTLDGSTPTTTSTKYIEGTQGFTLSESAVVKVIAVKLGMANSTVATSGDFTFTVAAPSISPNGGNFTVPVSVILSTTTSGADIYYTLDGGDPNTTSTKYIQGTQGFALSLPAVIKAVAVKSGMTNSTVAASNNFTFNTPTIAFGPILQDISYLYDCAGNITDIIDRSQTHSEKSVKYTYDGLNRLLNATTTTVANSQQTYALNYIYDAIGNIITRTEKIGSNPTKTYTYKYEGNLGSSYTNPHAVTSISDGTTTTTYLYDNNGNLTSAGNQIYNWSHRNEMTNVTGGATAIYEYDYTGQRIKSSNGTYVDIYPTKWYNINTVGKISKHIFAGSSMAATVETTSTTQVYTHHADHLSGQGATTSTSGSIVEILDYFPFGTTRFDDKVGSFSEQRKFAGLEHDVNTGLYYANARYYNPATGRFASQDAVFLQMGDRERIAGLVGDESLMQRILVDPQQLNSYSYARNNPITYTDKTGHAIETVADVISLALSTRDFYQNKTFWNGVFVGLDGLGLAVPFIPSGAGYIKNGAKIAKIANYFNRISDATGKSALSVTRLFAENIGFKFSRRAWSAGEAGESLGSLVGHFAKHGDEVDADNVGAYYNKANDFIDAKGTHSFGDPFPSNGDTIHYNPTTHEKAVTDKSGSIRSYYVENRTAYQSTYNSIINAK
jgi:RHS repeat-associated protein